MENRNCSFCDEHLDTTEYVFCYCKFASALWEDLHEWLFPNFDNFPVLTKENVIFGIFMNDVHVVHQLTPLLFLENSFHIKTDS